MLALLQLWRSLHQIKTQHETFRDTYENFLIHSSETTHKTVDNIQFFHDCSQSMLLHREATENMVVSVEHDHTTMDPTETGTEEHLADESEIFEIIITEADIESALNGPFSNLELLYADVAIGIGKDYGVLNNNEYAVTLQAPMKRPFTKQIAHFSLWANCLVNVPGNEIVDDTDPCNTDKFALPETDIASSVLESPSVFRLLDEERDVTKESPGLNEHQTVEIGRAHV